MALRRRRRRGRRRLSKESAEARYARQLESSVNAMLASTLGPGKAQVKVNADLNMDETTEKELTYAAKGTPLKTSEETEKLEGGSAAPRAARPAPARTSRPTRTATGTARRDPTTSARRRTPTTASTRRSATPKVAAGAVNKLNVALLVDKSVPAGRLQPAREDGRRRRRPRHDAR